MSMLIRNLARPSLRASAAAAQAARGFSSSGGEITINLGDDVFKTHNFEAPPTTVTTNKEELLHFFKEMYVMRRMEITNDTEYKARTIR
jgi:pyruvate dehydrogenase E1 component alpha subunit